MLVLLFALIAVLLHPSLVYASESDFLGNESDISGQSFEGNLSYGEPIVLTGDPEERGALVDQLYNPETQNALLSKAQEAASLCGVTFNTSISTHFRSSNAIAFVIHLSEGDEQYSPAFSCLLENFKGAHSILPEGARLGEVLAEENLETVREMLWWLDIAELRRLVSIKVGQ